MRRSEHPAVSVTRIEESGGWQVTVAAAGFVREDPLQAELRERTRTGLYAVDGVTTVEEGAREACLGARGHGDVPVPGLALADLVVVERAVGTTGPACGA